MGRIAGAGIDAWTSDPLPNYERWVMLENVVLTPHSAPSTPGVWAAGWKMISEIVFDAPEGVQQQGMIIPEVLKRA